jgi:hypothetical protein
MHDLHVYVLRADAFRLYLSHVVDVMSIRLTSNTSRTQQSWFLFRQRVCIVKWPLFLMSTLDCKLDSLHRPSHANPHLCFLRMHTWSKRLRGTHCEKASPTRVGILYHNIRSSTCGFRTTYRRVCCYDRRSTPLSYDTSKPHGVNIFLYFLFLHRNFYVPQCTACV